MRPRSPAVVLLTIALPLVILSIDFAGVAVALPEIGRDFGVPSSQAVWVVDAFALGAAGPLLVAGRVSDRIGRRRCLRFGPPSSPSARSSPPWRPRSACWWRPGRSRARRPLCS